MTGAATGVSLGFSLGVSTGVSVGVSLGVAKGVETVILTPSSGLKWQKKHFFRVFFNRNSSKHFAETKKCLGMISKHLMFSYLKIFSLKIFQDGRRGSKHGKFESKKQKFTNF